MIVAVSNSSCSMSCREAWRRMAGCWGAAGPRLPLLSSCWRNLTPGQQPLLLSLLLHLGRAQWIWAAHSGSEHLVGHADSRCQVPLRYSQSSKGATVVEALFMAQQDRRDGDGAVCTHVGHKNPYWWLLHAARNPCDLHFCNMTADEGNMQACLELVEGLGRLEAAACRT